MSNEIESAQVAGVEADRDFAISRTKDIRGCTEGLASRKSTSARA